MVWASGGGVGSGMSFFLTKNSFFFFGGGSIFL